jgi:hypothetical protein
MMNDVRFHEYMRWVREGIVFFLRPHPSLLKEDGVRAGVSWDSVVRIDGMVKLMLEQHRISYLPIESVSMQERVRAVEFVLARCGLDAHAAAQPAPAAAQPALGLAAPTPWGSSPTLQAASIALQAAAPALQAAAPALRTVETWPHALVPGALAAEPKA